MNKNDEKSGVRQRWWQGDASFFVSIFRWIKQGEKGVYACSTLTPDHSDERFSSGNVRKIATIRKQGFPHPLGRTQNRGFHTC